VSKRILPVEPEWLKADVTGRPVGVDRDNKVIRGYIVAQLGPFKTPGRGEFDRQSLETIVRLMNVRPAGTKSRFTHPGMSDDGLGKFLGRAKNARLDGNSVRADLWLDPSSFASPAGNIGEYVLTLAESDPEAFGSSLVLQTDREFRLEPDGTRKRDAAGEDLPPLWRPKKIHASDVVDEGDAVHDGFLTVQIVNPDALPDGVQRKGWELLDRLFGGQPREVTEARCVEYLRRYLENRYGHERGTPTDVLRRKNRLRSLDGI
jgi:hypothetical protein